jgi:hypothetical protein
VNHWFPVLLGIFNVSICKKITIQLPYYVGKILKNINNPLHLFSTLVFNFLPTSTKVLSPAK